MRRIYEYALRLPLTAFVLVFIFLSTGLLFILREACEGIPYNLSWTSQHGDLLLIGIAVLAIDIVRRRGAYSLPQWTDAWWFVGIAIIAIGALTFGALVFLWEAQHGMGEGVQVADAYHNLVVIPLLAALIVLSLPPILFLGSWWEFAFALGLGVGWMFLLVLDVAFERLAQQVLLAKMIRAYARRYGLEW